MPLGGRARKGRKGRKEKRRKTRRRRKKKKKEEDGVLFLRLPGPIGGSERLKSAVLGGELKGFV